MHCDDQNDICSHSAASCKRCPSGPNSQCTPPRLGLGTESRCPTDRAARCDHRCCWPVSWAHHHHPGRRHPHRGDRHPAAFRQSFLRESSGCCFRGQRLRQACWFDPSGRTWRDRDPILLTSTLSVPRVVDSLISYMSALSRRWFCQGSPASLP